MQESRRRRRLELHVLSPVAAAWFALSCGAKQPPDPPVVDAPPAALVPRDEASAPAAVVSNAAPPASDSPAPVQSAAAAASMTKAEASSPIELPRGTLVLHVGDSFAAALGIPLAKRFKAAGLRSILEFKTASYIPTWAFGKELRKYVANYNPDLVLVTLGANELEIPDPPQRIGAIKRLVATLGGRPCVWISPPLWKPDTGLLDVIREHAAPCRYLDSDSLVTELPRGPDKIHPSTEGRELWAEAVFGWLARSRDTASTVPWELRAGE